MLSGSESLPIGKALREIRFGQAVCLSVNVLGKIWLNPLTAVVTTIIKKYERIPKMSV
jgi:hypothetical protein